MLAMLMAGLVMKPVLAFAGDMHEGGHAVVAEGDAHAHDAPEATDPTDANDPLHALMHFAHCCGQTPALLQPMQPGPSMPAVAVLLPPWPVTFEPAVHPVDLRPPITT